MFSPRESLQVAALCSGVCLLGQAAHAQTIRLADPDPSTVQTVHMTRTDQSWTNFLDPRGYPRQMKHEPDTLPLTVGPAKRPFEFTRPGEFALVVPAADITYRGSWRKAGAAHRVAEGGKPDTISRSVALGLTKSTAHEISATLGASVTAGVKPFGLGVDVTLEATVGYAATFESGESVETAWTHELEVHPGEEVQLWVRAVEVTATYKPGNDEADKRYYIDEILVPTMIEIQRRALAPSLPPGTVKEVVGTMGNSFREIYRNPTVREKAWQEFRQNYPDGMSVTYEVPAEETYTVRYPLSKLDDHNKWKGN